jgi:hypothetical protein
MLQNLAYSVFSAFSVSKFSFLPGSKSVKDVLAPCTAARPYNVGTETLFTAIDSPANVPLVWIRLRAGF